MEKSYKVTKEFTDLKGKLHKAGEEIKFGDIATPEQRAELDAQVKAGNVKIEGEGDDPEAVADAEGEGGGEGENA